MEVDKVLTLICLIIFFGVILFFLIMEYKKIQNLNKYREKQMKLKVDHARQELDLKHQQRLLDLKGRENTIDLTNKVNDFLIKMIKRIR